MKYLVSGSAKEGTKTSLTTWSMSWYGYNSNKSQIPWELMELSPTQRSEMDGSHCMLLLQFIRQTVNMLGIVWAIISIWDSFKIKGTISTLCHNKCTERLSRNYYSLNVFHFIRTFLNLNVSEGHYSITEVFFFFFFCFLPCVHFINRKINTCLA